MNVEEKSRYLPTAEMIEKQKRSLEMRAHIQREAMFSSIYDKEYAPHAMVKRLRDMNGVEVGIVSLAMDTLGIMQTEARALGRVSREIGPDRILKKVMKKDEFTQFCAARPT